VECGWCRGDDVLVTFPGKIFGSAVQRRFQRGVLIVPGCIEINLSLTVEHPGHRVAGAQVSAVAAEGMADLGDGPIGIVGGCLDEDGGPPGP
jgi:hypothetical protein